ncbi:Leucine-rich_repeat domain superfamily [Hexamita inflata]|uniref:Leucine-rich_repeat domain superfamily n=1 Tax=Hexamita inflata TaxID=28002 RepID=A0ABP1JRV0_9EUKA
MQCVFCEFNFMILIELAYNEVSLKQIPLYKIYQVQYFQFSQKNFMRLNIYIKSLKYVKFQTLASRLTSTQLLLQNMYISIQLQNTGIQTIAACQLVKLLKNVKAIGRLDISNNQPSELAFYQIMKALKERGNGFSQEQITLDWVEVDEDDIREKVESYEEYSKIVEGISNLGKAIVFAK